MDGKLPPLQAGKVYQLKVTGRSVGQVERIMPVITGTVVKGFWPVAEDWTTYEMQFRLKSDARNPKLQFQYRGVGTWQVKEFSLRESDEFEIPTPPTADRGELVRNYDFAVGEDGWYRGHPGDYSHYIDPKQFGEYRWDAERSKYYLDLPAAEGERQITSQERFPVYFGKSYTLRIEGVGDTGFEFSFRYPIYGDQAPTVMETVRGEVKDGVFEKTFTLEPPKDGMLADGEPVFVQLRVSGEPFRLDAISLVEGEPGAAKAASAVKLIDVADTMGRSAWANEPIAFEALVNGVESGTKGELVVRDQLGEEVLRQPATVEPRENGQQSAKGTVEALPSGWFTLQFESGGSEMNAYDHEIVVLPRPLTLENDNAFMGTHYRGLHVARGKPNFILPERIVEIRNLGIFNQRQFTDWERYVPVAGVENDATEDVEKQVNGGLRILMQLGGPDKLKGDKWESYADLVRRTAERWKGKVNAYEVWNEPDLERVDIEEHVKACQIAYEQIKAVDPDAIVVAGAVTTSGRIYLEKSIQAGMLDHCDVVSFHGYVREQASDAGPASFNEFLDPIRALMKEKGKEKPIWDTESGFGIESGREGLEGSRTFLKALFARRAAGIERYYSYMAAVKGFPGCSHFNLFTGFNFRPVISQSLTAAFNRITGETSSVAEVAPADPQIQLFSFDSKDGGAVVLGGWALPGALKDGTTEFAQDRIKSGVVLDETGRKVGTFADGKLPLTRQVQYFVPESASSIVGALNP